MTNDTLLLRIQFPYSYQPSVEGEEFSWKCPYGSEENFLKAWGMKCLGVNPNNSSSRIAEQTIRVPFSPLVPIVIDESGSKCIYRLNFLRNKFQLFSEEGERKGECDAVSLANPFYQYYVANLPERKRLGVGMNWVCIQEQANYLWETGKFNEHMIGPYSIPERWVSMFEG